MAFLISNGLLYKVMAIMKTGIDFKISSEPSSLESEFVRQKVLIITLINNGFYSGI